MSLDSPVDSHSDTVVAVLREMTSSDIDDVLVINEANVPDVGSIDAVRLAHLLSEASIALVEDDEDSHSVVGFCLVFDSSADYDSENYRWFVNRDDRTMYLDRVAFDSSAAGRGLGSLMYAEVERRMRSTQPAPSNWTLEVNIDPPNERSLGFHRAHGFVEVGRRMSKGIEVSLMERPFD